MMLDPNSSVMNDGIQLAECQALSNSSAMADELTNNSPSAIGELKDYQIGTYKTTTDMPEELHRALPDIEELKKKL